MASNAKSLSQEWPTGVWVNLSKVLSLSYPDNEISKKVDISILAILEVDHSKYDKKLFLGGKHLFDDDGNFKDYGKRKNGITEYGSWQLGHFLTTLGVNQKRALNSAGTKLADGVEEQIINVPFYLLEYESSGARKRQIWRFFAKESEGKGKLINQWKEQEDIFVPNNYLHKHKDPDRLENMYNSIDDNKEPWEK